MTSLLADIGGTNTRCAITGPDGRHGSVQAFSNRDFDSLRSLLSSYVASLPQDDRPRNGALAIAAPVRGDDVHMTNIDWRFSISDIRDALNLEDLRALNDFEALAYSLPALGPEELLKIGGGDIVKGKPKGVIGPGTGLGVASLMPIDGRWIALPGEGGHATLPATDPEEERVIAKVRAEFGHCSGERLISGLGLSLLHRALHGGDLIDAAELSVRAEAGDAQADDTFGMFFRLLGTLASNLALTIGAFGGIYIGGGIAPRHRERLVTSGFRERFEAKGRYDGYLKSVATLLIVAEHPALAGLAAIAEAPERPA
ncbi:MAG: glucokinase [Gammaproteobacteria bacterium]|nr:glucokinase [Gammaproteobacteria bacterium]